MKYWLVKSEPDAWSWDDQLAASGKTTRWDGVRNPQALANLKSMKSGDRALFYHSGRERRAMGVVEVVGEHRPDPSDATGRAVMVDLRAVESLAAPVTLAQIKADRRLKQLALVRQGRLSVAPVDAASWKIILGLGGLKP